MAKNRIYTDDEMAAAITLIELSQMPSPAFITHQPNEATTFREQVRCGCPRNETPRISCLTLPKESSKSSANSSTGDAQYVALTYCIVSPVVSEKVRQTSALANNQMFNAPKDGAESDDQKYVDDHSNAQLSNKAKVVDDEDIVQRYPYLQRNAK